MVIAGSTEPEAQVSNNFPQLSILRLKKLVTRVTARVTISTEATVSTNSLTAANAALRFQKVL